MVYDDLAPCRINAEDLTANLVAARLWCGAAPARHKGRHDNHPAKPLHVLNFTSQGLIVISQRSSGGFVLEPYSGPMLWVGTSGYNYPEWKGTFYPPTLPAAKMLPYYAERFPTVEINYTFYRAPNEKILGGWNKATPDRFKLTLKAPRRITHDARLRDCADRVRQFLETASTLGPKLGALLFQLPPTLKKDIALFDAFLDAFPPRVCAAFEFRHPSWLDEEVYSRLRARNLALCVADSERLSTPVVITADYAYFRLRDEGYTPGDIGRWADTIREQTVSCREVFVYFKHEESGKGPEFARLLIETLSSDHR